MPSRETTLPREQVSERFDFVDAASEGEREAMRKAWLDLDCTHEFPEDCRIWFVLGWFAAARHFA